MVYAGSYGFFIGFYGDWVRWGFKVVDPYFKVSNVEVGCPPVSSNLYSNLWCPIIFPYVSYDVPVFSYDFPMSFPANWPSTARTPSLREICVDTGGLSFWPRWRRGHHGKARQKDGIGWTIVMFFNEKVASYSHNIPANETIINGNILGIWQEYLLNDIQFFHTLMWILMNIIYAF